MPVRNFVILLALFIACIAIVVLAWASGSQLYLCLPLRGRRGPPTSPGLILIALMVAGLFYLRLQFMSAMLCGMLAFGICLGTAVGWLVYGWTPTVCQHLLALALVATAVYAWRQRYYLEE